MMASAKIKQRRNVGAPRMTGALFHTGIIEGFFGKPWSWQERAGYAGFLEDIGFGFYIYAPKAEARLRRDWREDLPTATVAALRDTAAAYRAAGLSFGIGLSPFEIYLDAEEAAQADLQRKIAQLNEIDPDILCILFDDMRGDLPSLAQRQAAILGQVTELSSARRFVFCPTYYAADPKLEEVFGSKPANYLEDLGRLVDPRVDIFWTGPLVCSAAYPEDHLNAVAETLRRKPFLWDNYPVNDGAKTSNFLHLGAFRSRPASLRKLLAGHAVNPMNQAWLSRIPIRTLAESYRLGPDYDPEHAFTAACESLCGAALGPQILRDLPLFQDRGLAGLDAPEREALIRRYARFADNPYAAELVAWLEGAYAFDPACLTD